MDAMKDVILGIDLGGTKISIGVVEASGKILRQKTIKTGKKGPHAVIKDIVSLITTLRSPDEHILAAGIGMAGQIDGKTGVVHFAPNLGWINFPLRESLEIALNIPIKVTNDVRAAAWGEWLYGAGKDCNDLICLFIGTGIGAGIVTGGNMLNGSSNTAGEVGHMTLDMKGPVCTCGNIGCFEALASGWAIAKQAREAVLKNPLKGEKLLEIIGGTFEEITAKKIFAAYFLKDPISLKIIEEAKEAWIAGIAGLANAFNPSKIILGGGIMNESPFLIECIREGVSKRGLKTAVESLEIVPAALKEKAGIIGASAVVWNSLNL